MITKEKMKAMNDIAWYVAEGLELNVHPDSYRDNVQCSIFKGDDKS